MLGQLMKAIGKLTGWLGRKAFLYVALVIAIGTATIIVPWVKQVIFGTTPTQIRANVLSDAMGKIDDDQEAAKRAFLDEASSLESRSLKEINDRKQRREIERRQLEMQGDTARPYQILALTDPAELLANEQRKLRIRVIKQELSALSAAEDLVRRQKWSFTASASLAQQQKKLSRAIPLCNSASAALNRYEARWRWRVRSWVESADHKRLTAEKADRCGNVADAKKRLNQLSMTHKKAAAAKDKARSAFLAASSDTKEIMRSDAELAKSADDAKIELNGSMPEKLRLWAKKIWLQKLLQQAALAFGVILAIPFVIRLFCYFLLAPLAMRRATIRLRIPHDANMPIAPSAASSTSVSIELGRGEELLVRQDYLQTSSSIGRKRTQWFLDWRKPFTSMASGLAFLIRIRGDGEVTTVSAVREGLAEVTILELPEGAACALKPRALAAVVQPIGRKLEITRHWRLGSLNAWLTLQLRYLVFHGPARLILKGGRGVRVERAENGRIFGQNQLVGFSSDLAYSITRTETFWPYFLGREQLLKDRVMAGEGVIIVEEAPFSTPDGSRRSGIEGMLDAGMKAFGL